jgi:hypothetical protein
LGIVGENTKVAHSPPVLTIILYREYLVMNNLEVVFPVGNQWHDRIFYDSLEGKYYDRYSDIYLEYDDLAAYGLT